jgi:hypothetical protein
MRNVNCGVHRFLIAELRYTLRQVGKTHNSSQEWCNMHRGETDARVWSRLIPNRELFRVIFGHPVHVHEDRVSRTLAADGA